MGRGIVSHVKELNNMRCLAVVDSINAQVWNNTAGLEMLDGVNGVTFALPASFTIECGFFMVDSVCKRHGGGEFEIFFRNYKTQYANELNVKIFNSGKFEMNCDAEDSRFIQDNKTNWEMFYNSYAKS
ncbi:MAG: hypothetical protein ABI378_14080, partial [Chitinophagaceae bacterium]